MYGVWHKDSHQISPTVGASTQVGDFTEGKTWKNVCENDSAKKWGGQGDPDPLVGFIGVSRDDQVL